MKFVVSGGEFMLFKTFLVVFSIADKEKKGSQLFRDIYFSFVHLFFVSFSFIYFIAFQVLCFRFVLDFPQVQILCKLILKLPISRKTITNTNFKTFKTA